MKNKPEKSNKIFKLGVFMTVFVVSVVLLSSNTQATIQKLIEWYPGDYSFRSGLELNTQYYQGSTNLVKEIEYFYEAEAPLIGDPNKEYNGMSGDFFTDRISWVVKGFPAKDKEDSDIDYTLAVSSPRLEGTLTKMYHPTDKSLFKQYYVGYEHDDYGNVILEKNYGELISYYPVSKDYYYEWTYNPTDPLNSWLKFTKLTTLNGTLNIDECFDIQWLFDTFPQDNVITKTEYLHEYEVEEWMRDQLVYRNLVSLPSTVTTTDFFGRQLSKTYYGYKRNDPVFGGNDLEWCGNTFYAGYIPHESFMFNPNYSSTQIIMIDGEGNWPYRYGGLVGSIIDQGPFAIPDWSDYTVWWSDDYTIGWSDTTWFNYDMCGNLINITTLNPYIKDGAIEVSENRAKTSYGSGNNYQSSKYNVPLSIKTYGNSTSNTPLTKDAGYYTFDTTYTKYWVPPIDAGSAPMKIPHVGSGLDYVTVPSTKVKNTTDENGIKSYYEYDDLGRIKKITVDPDDPQTSFTKRYTYFTSQNSEWKVLVEEKISDNIIKETYFIYDGLGRLKQTQLKKDASTIIVSDIKYDKLGRKYLESKPRQLTAAFGTYLTPTWGNLEYIEYGYDTLSRIVYITYPNGDQIERAYRDDENKITIYDENLHWKNYYYDAFNNLITVEEQQP